MKNSLLLFIAVLIGVFLISCSGGTGNIQGEIKLNLIEHIEGKDLGGTTVKIKGRNETAATDKDGKFTLKNIEAGTYTLTISRDDWDTKEVDVNITGGDIAELNETLDYSFGIVAGKLENLPNMSTPNYTINLVQKENETVTYQQTTGTDFLMNKVQPGTYSVKITNSDTKYHVISFELIVPKNWYRYFTDLNTDEHLDFDGDGIPNKDDPDIDGDGVPNEMDCVLGKSEYKLVFVAKAVFCISKNTNKWNCHTLSFKDAYGWNNENWENDFAIVASGSSHFCGIDNENILWCWGHTEESSPNYQSIPVENIGIWKNLWAGQNRLCALSDADNLYCWQSSIYGEGRKINDDTDWLNISLGNDEFYAIKTNGTLWSWSFGENPEQIGTDLWKFISNTSPYAIKSDGTLQYISNILSPIPVGTDTDWEAVYGTCAIKTDNTLWCWSDSDKTPATKTDSIGWSCGEWKSISHYKKIDIEPQELLCGVKTDGSLWCLKDGIMTNIDSLPLN
jgi:hypothetical protein